MGQGLNVRGEQWDRGEMGLGTMEEGHNGMGDNGTKEQWDRGEMGGENNGTGVKWEGRTMGQG